ncbi:MAG: ribosome small subunit-dependent GTPase A [Patescibacteria group bacterium]
MSDLWERRENKQAKAKKDARFKHGFDSRESKKSDPWVRATESGVNEKIAILSSIHKNRLEILYEGITHDARLDSGISPGVLRDLAVGDQVAIGEQDKNGVVPILWRKERRSFIARMRGHQTRSTASLHEHVLSANVDIGVIVVALQNPDFHPRFIDRYLVILQDGNVQPIICLTKCDLSSERPGILKSYQGLGISVIETSSISHEGIEKLKELLQGRISVFLGQSGVGKSSLVHALNSTLEVKTGSVNPKTNEGRHTTTGSNLYKWSDDSFIIDTPGIRSLGLEAIPKEEIRFLFPEFLSLASSCKFTDCLHLSEPECAVRAAAEGGDTQITLFRYESYQRMMKE